MYSWGDLSQFSPVITDDLRDFLRLVYIVRFFLVASAVLKWIVSASMEVFTLCLCDGFLGALSEINRFKTHSVRLCLQKCERNQKKMDSVNEPLN